MQLALVAALEGGSEEEAQVCELAFQMLVCLGTDPACGLCSASNHLQSAGGIPFNFSPCLTFFKPKGEGGGARSAKSGGFCHGQGVTVVPEFWTGVLLR